MATWDQGGGCACGIRKVCDCKIDYRKKQVTVKEEGWLQRQFDYVNLSEAEEEINNLGHDIEYLKREQKRISKALKDKQKELLATKAKVRKYRRICSKNDDYYYRKQHNDAV